MDEDLDTALFFAIPIITIILLIISLTIVGLIKLFGG